MKHDPLLNKQWAPPAVENTPSQVSSETEPKIVLPPRREKHPALSSRILATGFSLAAVIGMSAAYAKAQKAQDLQKLIDEQTAANSATASTNSNVQSQNAPADLAPAITPNTTQIPAEAPVTTSAPQPVVTAAPNIVQVPVQPAQPAQPAYTPPSQNRGSQSSGGSQ